MTKVLCLICALCLIAHHGLFFPAMVFLYIFFAKEFKD